MKNSEKEYSKKIDLFLYYLDEENKTTEEIKELPGFKGDFRTYDNIKCFLQRKGYLCPVGHNEISSEGRIMRRTHSFFSEYKRKRQGAMVGRATLVVALLALLVQLYLIFK